MTLQEEEEPFPQTFPKTQFPGRTLLNFGSFREVCRINAARRRDKSRTCLEIVTHHRAIPDEIHASTLVV